MYVILSIFTGLLVSVMIQLNGVLQMAVGGNRALLSIHIFGLAGALVFLAFTGRRMKGDPENKSPVFFLTAGMAGTLIVFLASVIFGKGGILLSLSGSLAGQTLAASIFESFYSEKRDPSPLVQRVISPALLIPGSILIGVKAGVGPLWILVSWTPGVILMAQQMMNSRNTSRYGTPRTIVFNYLSALILIIPLYLATSAIRGDAALSRELFAELNSLPWYITAGGGLIGVFSTGMIAYLLLKSPALVVTLGIYAGELAGGLVLDYCNGEEFEILKLAGILLVSAGMAAGRIRVPGIRRGRGRKEQASHATERLLEFPQAPEP